MDDTQDPIQLIKERFRELPQEMKDAITASDLPAKMKAIAQTHNLMLDQTGLLQNEILFILLGLERSSDFVGNVSKELGIPTAKSTLIAKDVNEQILNPVRTHLREWEEQAESQASSDESAQADISALERAGGFSVEPSMASTSADGQQKEEGGVEQVSEKDKNDILSSIEDPKPAISRVEENHYEPLVDHLLGTSNTQPEQKIVHTAPEPPANLPSIEETPVEVSKPVIPVTQQIPSTPIVKPVSEPKTAPVPPKAKGPDPYRESIV